MRLIILSSEFPPGPGGIGTHAHQVAWHLSQNGWKVLVMTPQDYAPANEIDSFNKSQPFTIIRLPKLAGVLSKFFYRWHVVSKYVKTWQPDILLVSGDRQIYLATWLAQYYRFPWVAVEHGRAPTSWEYWLKRYSLHQATAAVFVSQFTRQQILAKGICPKKEQVIPNGADPSRFKVLSHQDVQQYKKKLKLGTAHLLLTVGNVTKRKGQDVVIRALPMILEAVPNTHYLIAGLPTLKKEFESLAQQLGVADKVHFLGCVDPKDLVHLLNCCDIFVMTSRHIGDEFEGFGIAVVEAALCGKPAVVSTNSGIVEAIVPQQTGLSVPPGDETATAQAVISLLKDNHQRLTMGQTAQKRASKTQTWASRIKEYDVLLRGLLPTSQLNRHSP
jgi:phosphatidylinositol alpha-1,6-mannosyltransferase